MALTDLLAAFASNGLVAGKGISSTTKTSDIGINGPEPGNFINDNPASSTARASINWILFDDQFKYVTADFDLAQLNGGHKQHTKFINAPVNVTKNGYLYIYVSNESDLPVFFDNLNVTHTNGPIMEETHYYPFGLTMAGISSKAMGKLDNKKEFNGNELQNKEFTDRSGLELYDFNARTYDQQIGRFIQVDSMTDEGNQESLSPYHFSYNNPIRYNDPDGKCPCLIPALPAIGQAIAAGVAAVAIYLTADAAAKGTANVIKNGATNGHIDKIPLSMGLDGSTLPSDYTLPSFLQSNTAAGGNESRKEFGSKSDTKSETAKEALRNAKDQNSIPRSQQPDKTIKPNTPEGDRAGLDNRNVKQYEYTNSKGEKVVIRQDKPVKYNEGGKGDQGPHFNAGPKSNNQKDLNQHHKYGKQFWEVW